jgi:hypothetical protein
MKGLRNVFPPLAALVLSAAFSLTTHGENTNQEAPVTPLQYETPVTLSGVLIREWDMSWVGTGDTPNTQDPKVAAAAEAQAANLNDDRPHKPSLHYILKLTQPISLVAGSEPDANPAESKITEIDIIVLNSNLPQKVKDKDFGKKQFRVTGTLEHANTVHQLRPVIILAKSINAVQ